MSDLEAFRGETRAWLTEHAPPSMRAPWKTAAELCWGGRRPHVNRDAQRWLEIMAERGWTAPTWPREIGGGGLSAEQAAVLREVMGELSLRPPLIGFGLTMIGPLLLAEGSPAQKQRHLPPIVRGEIRWCQGYSEPEAGSDLAGLRTLAVRQGEELVVTGQKIWTSHADESDWMFLLVRTDPAARKQDGISFLLMDMASPGVSVRPILLISGASPFCETFLAEVRVPADQLVGQVNGGWRIAKALLAHERTMISQIFEQKDDLGQLCRWARAHAGDVEGRIADEVLRRRIAEIEIDTAALGETVAALRAHTTGGHPSASHASLVKLAGTELNQRRRALAVEILGSAGLGWEGAGFGAEELLATRDWLRSRANTIEGGTSEIQLNILAREALEDSGARLLDDDEDVAPLAETARDWVKSRAPVRRPLDDVGFSRALWQEMIAMGWPGILAPDSGLGHRHVGALLHELGKQLAPEPIGAALLLGHNLVALGGAPGALLAETGAGRALVTLAHEEPGVRPRGGKLGTRAEPRPGGFRLSGAKTHIPAAAAATHVVVSALLGDAVELFLVPAGALALTPLARIDGRAHGQCTLAGVEVPAEGRLRSGILDAVLDRQLAGLAAELVGLASGALAMTVAYLKTRSQFGAPIASFQALQHRVARLFVERELARAATRAALHAIDADRDVARRASGAFVLAASMALHVAEETIQLHGGIGMTEQHDAGRYLKRARALAAAGGDLGWHRARIAALGGY